LTSVSENTLLQQQDRADLRTRRKQLLKLALRCYTGFIAKHGDDPKLQAELSDAYSRVGSITQEIDSKEDALRSYERALEIRQKLADADPAVTEYQSALADSHNNIGIRRRRCGHTSGRWRSGRSWPMRTRPSPGSRAPWP
jgi:tetratricopeptide (TPR) repeat protein